MDGRKINTHFFPELDTAELGQVHGFLAGGHASTQEALELVINVCRVAAGIEGLRALEFALLAIERVVREDHQRASALLVGLQISARGRTAEMMKILLSYCGDPERGVLLPALPSSAPLSPAERKARHRANLHRLVEEGLGILHQEGEKRDPLTPRDWEGFRAWAR